MSELCKGADVIVLADNDDPGKTLASTVVRDLIGTAKSIKVSWSDCWSCSRSGICDIKNCGNGGKYAGW